MPKRSKQMPEMAAQNVAGPPVPMGLMAEANTPRPEWEERNQLMEEVRRSIRRAIAHCNAHRMDYDVSRLARISGEL